MTLTLEVDYKYDAVGNRIERDRTSGGATTVTRFAYDRGNVWADLDGSNTLQARHFFTDAVDQVFARIAYAGGTGTLMFDLTDHLGSVRNLLDSSGVLQDTITYDAYGQITSETNAAAGDRYKYTGREFDTDTGLQYNRARDYDPKAERWLQQDPIQFDSGDSNLYRYTSDNPTNAADPTGLRETPNDNPNHPKNRKLVDVSDILEDHVDKVTARAWDQAKAAGDDARGFVKRVYEQLGANAPGSGVKTKFGDFAPIAKIAVWLDFYLSVDKNQIAKWSFRQSRYGDNPASRAGVLYIPWLYNDETAQHGLAPTIRVNGVVMGTDKWEHFFQQGFWLFDNGMTYDQGKTYSEWLEGVDNARGSLMDLYPALPRKWGVKWDQLNPPRKHAMIDTEFSRISSKYGERTWFGKYGSWSSGVISHADVNANLAGMEFYRKLYTAYNDGAANPPPFLVSQYRVSEFNEHEVENTFVKGLQHDRK
jgi:RHS repeat-associated protein